MHALYTNASPGKRADHHAISKGQTTGSINSAVQFDKFAFRPEAGPRRSSARPCQLLPRPRTLGITAPTKVKPNLAKQVDLVELHREAYDLAGTALSIPYPASVSKGMLPKPVILKLKQMEKLSKQLRLSNLAVNPYWFLTHGFSLRTEKPWRAPAPRPSRAIRLG
jgi:hypothetical protein